MPSCGGEAGLFSPSALVVGCTRRGSTGIKECRPPVQRNFPGSDVIAIENVNDAGPIEWLIFSIFALNVVDAVATLIWVATGLAIEANPLMARLIEYHPVAFVIVKMSLVLLGSILLWRLRDRIFAVATLVFLFVVYYALLLFHLLNGARVYLQVP